MSYLYSAKNNTFYSSDDLDIYKKAGTLPDDLVTVSSEVVNEFSPFTNGDKVRVAGEDGFPAWGERPPMTPESAAIIKNSLMNTANAAITPLQDAVDLDMATDGEKAQLTAWKKYRVLLNRVDTSKAPAIEWPEKPA